MFLLIKCDFTFKKKNYIISPSASKKQDTHSNLQGSYIIMIVNNSILFILMQLFSLYIMIAIIQKYIKNNSHL